MITAEQINKARFNSPYPQYDKLEGPAGPAANCREAGTFREGRHRKDAPQRSLGKHVRQHCTSLQGSSIKSQHKIAGCGSYSRVYRYRSEGALLRAKIAHQKFTVSRACAYGSTSLQSVPSMASLYRSCMAQIQRMGCFCEASLLS